MHVDVARVVPRLEADLGALHTQLAIRDQFIEEQGVVIADLRKRVVELGGDDPFDEPVADGDGVVSSEQGIDSGDADGHHEAGGAAGSAS